MTTLVVHANDPLALTRTTDVLGGVAFAAAPGAVYIGRANRRANNPIAHTDSPWRNPWTIPVLMRNGTRSEGAARRAALDGYAGWLDQPRDMAVSALIERERRDWILDHVHELRGAVLVCWCATPGRPLTAADHRVCHGQILAERADRG